MTIGTGGLGARDLAPRATPSVRTLKLTSVVSCHDSLSVVSLIPIVHEREILVETVLLGDATQTRIVGES